MRELIENRDVGLALIVFSLGELRENYSLNVWFEIKVDVVELSYRIANNLAIDS
jgi:hypothetical protein